jgi:glutamine amidotransferase
MVARVAIVDFGMGNLYSVRQACANAGLDARITASGLDVDAADAVILPGVGAFADAMASLRATGMVTALRRVAASGKPLVGICLGLQLLMKESCEFGRHEGLGLVDGRVVYLDHPRDDRGPLKVPHVGWNRIARCHDWHDTLLDGVADGGFMYFVHSLHVEPVERTSVLSTTTYGDAEFCSSLAEGNVFACQFHPERSGLEGLLVYRNLAHRLVAACA